MEHTSDTARPEDEADRVEPAAGEMGDPAAEGGHEKRGPGLGQPITGAPES